MLNRFLMELPWEMRESLLNMFGGLKWPMYIAVLLWVSFRYPIAKKQKLFLWVIMLIASFGCGEFCFHLNRITNGITPAPNMGVAFLFFCLITAVLAYAVKLPVLLTLDALIPAYILGRGVAIIGCLIYGCCHGYPCDFGVYSIRTDCITFPTVLLDSTCSVGITAYLIFLTQKNRYAGNGQTTAMGLLLFGILRTVIDILRDNHKLIFLLTFEGFCGIAYILAGVLLLRKLRASQNSKTL